MKKPLTAILLIAGIAAAINTTNLLAQKGEKTSFEIKPNVSSIQWTGKKVTGEHTGTVLLKNGKVDVANGKLTGGVFEIDMTSITDTDMEGEWKGKLEGHLKSEDFFSTEKFPVSTLQITKAEPVKDKTYDITGKLTIKGITNEITFPATVEMELNKFAAYADFNIDRTLWDIRYGSKKFFEDIGDKMIYDDFNLKLKIGATK